MSLLERYYPGPPEEVERRGLEKADRLVPPLPLSPEERALALRVVWATGDPTLAPLLRFHPRAVTSGREALARGAPIIVDTRTTEAGIDRALVEQVGSSLTCVLSLPGLNEEARGSGLTRSATALRLARDLLTRAVVAIGTAPSALLALLDLVDGGAVSPALIIGTPVGLVVSAEAKEELARRAVPFITLSGTRGGGAVASTLVNALLRLALVTPEGKEG